MNDHLTGGLLGLHTMTSIHPGSGTALGTVDLPVQRERHTHWPNIGGSAIKGIMRDATRERVKERHQDDGQDIEEGQRLSQRDKADADDELTAIFGPPGSNADKHAGALSVTDARLLAFPVRSLKGVFAWVTCGQVLERLRRDASIVGVDFVGDIPSPEENQAIVAQDSPLLLEKTQLILEEFQFTTQEGDVTQVADWIAHNLLPDTSAYKTTRDRFVKHLVILHDNDFTHFAEQSSEIVARIGLDYHSKTVREGALFYQEFLPAETLFYAVVIANASRNHNSRSSAAQILASLTSYLPPILQIGGDETTGKGYCSTRLYTKAGGQQS